MRVLLRRGPRVELCEEGVLTVRVHARVSFEPIPVKPKRKLTAEELGDQTRRSRDNGNA